jgi:hypothetical protein
LASRQLTRDDIINDSGASAHTFNDLKWFSELVPLSTKLTFASANRGDCIVEYTEIAHFKAMRSDGGITHMDLRAVYCPQALCNLMSAGQLRTSWLNGQSEQAGRTITEKARTVLLQRSVPERFWPFAEESAAMVTNLLPTRANPSYESPYERLAKALGLNEHVQFPYIMHLQSYLSTAYVYIKSKDRAQSAKMAPRTKKGLLIGYIDQRGRLFWIWLPEEGRIIKASAVKFQESDTDDSDKIYENVEYEAVLDDPTVHDILQDSGVTTSHDERDKIHDETPIPTVEKKILTPDESDDTVPFPTPEQTPECENQSDNSEYSPEDSGLKEAEATERFVGRHIREEEIRDEELSMIVVIRREPIDQTGPSVRRSERNRNKELGYYKTLHKKSLETKAGTSYTNLQTIVEPTLQAGLCLIALKAEHIVNYNPNPKNYRQARKLQDFRIALASRDEETI